MNIQALIIVSILLGVLVWVIGALPNLSALLILVAGFAFCGARCRPKQPGGK